MALFGITMPLKHWADIRESNIFVGYAHGVLFIFYVIIAVVFCRERKWGIKRFMILFIASLLPFGTFYADQKYLKGLSIQKALDS